MELATQTSAAPASAQLSIDKLVEGQVTCLRFQGTINEGFDGKKTAAQVKAQTLILDLGGVKRVSSFGIREWTDFIAHVEKGVQKIIAIECPPKVVDQMNMVAQFLGAKGVIFSFYAPYRCDYCDIDNRILLQVDRDAQAIRSMNPPERACESCSRPEYFDEDASSFFSFVALQRTVEIAPDVADFMASKLRYSVTGAERRLQIDKHVEGRYTYLKLVGNLDGSFPSSKVAEGLEGVVVVDVSGVGTIDLAGAAEWRNFVTQAKSSAEQISLLGCPPILLERLTRQEDLGDAVISFSMPYSCAKCATTTSQMIDVEEHHDIIKFATPPEMKCTQCKSMTVCVAPETLLSRLRTLPKAALDTALRKFIKETRERKPAKTEAARSEVPGQPRTGMWLGLMFVALLGVGGLVAFNMLQTNKIASGTKPTQPMNPIQSPGHNPADDRPAWISGDTPLSAYCADRAGKMQCVGISSYIGNKDAGRAEAATAAVEELVNQIALKSDDKTFGEAVRPIYDQARTQALAALESAQATPDSDEYARALENVRNMRRLASEMLARTGGSAVPQQQAAWYWEEYKKTKGEGSEFLVFVRYDINVDGIKDLLASYTLPVDVDGGQIVSAFPLLVWRMPEVKGGAFVLKAGGLGKRGAKPGDVVTALGDQPVANSEDLVAKLKSGGNAQVTVLTPPPAAEAPKSAAPPSGEPTPGGAAVPGGAATGGASATPAGDKHPAAHGATK